MQSLKMKSNILLLFILFLGSCNGNDIEGCLKCKLQGEWIGSGDEEVLIIQGDSIIEGQPWLIKFFEPYKIIDYKIFIDSIRYRKFEGVKKYKYEINSRIDNLREDTLKITRQGPKESSWEENWNLVKLKPHNKYQFKSIEISSSPCHGACPIFQLSIDSNGILNFQGEKNVDSIGDFQGRISGKNLELLQNQIDKVDWEYLEKEYWGESSDGQYFRLEMIDQASTRYRVLTKSTKTKALNILIFYAFNIAKNTNLKSVFESFDYKTDLKKEQKTIN